MENANRGTRVRDTDAGSVLDSRVRNALRSFAGKMAHDYNNLLTPLLAYPNLIRAEIRKGSTAEELVDVIEDSAENMASIASRLTSFALPVREASQALNVEKSLHDAFSNVENDRFAQGVSLEFKLEPGLKIMATHDALSTAFMEICRNSLEAMQGHGRLSVASGRITLETDVELITGVAPAGGYVYVAVSDTGPGIDPEYREKVFEPFFSTRREGRARGAGLGLSIALTAVRECAGYIDFSPVGEPPFTVSFIYPDMSTQSSVETVAESKPQVVDKTEFSNARVMVVDDETSIVDLFKLMLESSLPGSLVDIAHNGQEAVDLFSQNHHQVIIMDLHMPVMDGQTAFKALVDLCDREGWNMPRVVFCTGYSPPDGVQKAISGESQHDLLHKPVTADSLVRAVKAGLIE